MTGVERRRKLGGLIGVKPKMPVRDNHALSLIYTPGVAEPCRAIARHAELSYRYTWRWNAVAVVGAGPASLPLLESMAATLKLFGGVEAVPLVIDRDKAGGLAAVVRAVEPTFGAVWLPGVALSEGVRAVAALADLSIPVLRAPRDSEHGLADPAVYPGLIRAVLDLRLGELDPRLVVEAVRAAGEDVLSFASAPRVARAVADKAAELGLGATGVTGARIERRLRDYLETGRLDPFDEPGDWLAADTPEEQALRLHAHLAGGIEMAPTRAPRDAARWVDLVGDVDEIGRAAARSPELVDQVTGRSNRVAVITDGTAVLGLGKIGAAAGLPVMLGKSVLFKVFAGCDAVPVCIDAEDPRAIVEVTEAIAPSFGGINLEDISAPRCFEIEDELKRRLDIFVFHDDQHGTAVVTLAGLLNAARLCERGLDELAITFNGAGAAGIAVTRLLLAAGVRDVILCDRAGPIYAGRDENMNPVKEEIAARTNRAGVRGTLADAVKGRHVFIGLSAAGVLTGEMIRTMADRPVILAMANPVPEVMPAEAYAAGAVAVGTGRSDFPNQINNCLGFPGIFRGALDVRARSINDAMKIAAADAIAGLVPDGQLRPDYFIPSAMDLRVSPVVAAAIARAAIETGEARAPADPAEIARRTRRFLYEARLDRRTPT